MNKDTLQIFKERLITNEWRSSYVNHCVSEYNETINFTNEIEYSSIYTIDSIFLFKESLFKNKIKYAFQSDSLTIIFNKTKLLSDKWSLSKDGKYIILGNGTNPNNYIELIKCSIN